MGEAIKIPINDTGYAKYRRDPAEDVKPKYIADRGLKATLYGWPLAKEHDHILITEGELDCLVAWSRKIPAVSSTAGARTFLPEWAQWLATKQVTICFDNDDTGAEAMVLVLKMIPHAKIMLIPERPNVKDITDYVQHGGDLHELMRTAKHYTSLDQVKEERAQRKSVFDSVRFHDAYIEEFTPKRMPNSRARSTEANTDVERAKAIPVTQIMQFTHRKAPCVWHDERTPSMHYYPKTNSVYCFGCGKHGDTIDVYRQIHNCDFKTALNELLKL